MRARSQCCIIYGSSALAPTVVFVVDVWQTLGVILIVPFLFEVLVWLILINIPSLLYLIIVEWWHTNSPIKVKMSIFIIWSIQILIDKIVLICLFFVVHGLFVMNVVDSKQIVSVQR